MAARCFHLPVCVVYDQAVPGNVAVTGCKDERGAGDLPLLPENPIWPRSLFSLCKECKTEWHRAGAGKRGERSNKRATQLVACGRHVVYLQLMLFPIGGRFDSCVPDFTF